MKSLLGMRRFCAIDEGDGRDRMVRPLYIWHYSLQTPFLYHRDIKRNQTENVSSSRVVFDRELILSVLFQLGGGKGGRG